MKPGKLNKTVKDFKQYLVEKGLWERFLQACKESNPNYGDVDGFLYDTPVSLWVICAFVWEEYGTWEMWNEVHSGWQEIHEL